MKTCWRSMSRLSLLNLLIGFFLIFVSAASGAFLANDLTVKYLSEKTLVDNWASLIQKSAHGHTNLFGIIHICLGLTLPYSLASKNIKGIQTLGLSLGSIAMSLLMIIRSLNIPDSQSDNIGFAIGFFLSASLVSLFTHILGIGAKLFERE